MATTDALPLRLAGENLAAAVRERLAEARARGEPFDSAWHGAVAPLRLDEAPGATKAEWRELEGWAAALRWARSAFQSAYAHETPGRGERAAAALEEAA